MANYGDKNYKLVLKNIGKKIKILQLVLLG